MCEVHNRHIIFAAAVLTMFAGPARVQSSLPDLPSTDARRRRSGGDAGADRPNHLRRLTHGDAWNASTE
jgi:hypothetical protein